MRKIQSFWYNYTSRNSWTGFFLLYSTYRTLKNLPKCLFSFALRKGKIWSFSLPVGATGIFKRPLRGLKTAKTPAWVKNLPEWEVRKFRSSLFKGLQVSKGQSPLFAQGTDSYAFSQLLKPSKSGIPKKLTHFRLALDAVRSAGVNLWNSPGDCFTKRGRSARESAP